MITPIRILEILVCSLVTFLPYVLVSVLPFRNKLRYGTALTAVFALFAAIMQLGCDMIVACGLLENPGIAKLVVLLVHVIFFMILIQASFGKKMFLLLGLINFSLVITMGTSILKGLLFSADTNYLTWTELVITLVLQVLFLLPFGIITSKLAPVFKSSRNVPFNWLWLPNLLVLAAWVVMNVADFPHALNLLVVAILSGAILAVSPSIVRRSMPAKAPRRTAPKAEVQPAAKEETPEQPAPAQAEVAVPQVSELPEIPVASASRDVPQIPEIPDVPVVPAPQAAPAPKAASAPKAAPQPASDRIDNQLPVLQRNNLLERIAESNQFHRELNRHVEAMAYRMERQQYAKLHVHIHALQEQLTKENQARYCDNKEISAIIAYFTRMAGYCGAQFFTNMHVSAEPKVPTADLTLMLSSMLDYALTCCKDVPGFDRRIYASIRNNGKSMYLNVEFSCASAVQATGIGMNTCHEIVNRHNGALETSCINGIFKATAILHPTGIEAPSTDPYHMLLRKNLLERVAESNQFHRELLRHVDAMAYRLERKQYDKLGMHIRALQEQLAQEGKTSHCTNSEIDSVIAYFIRMAGYCGAQVFTNVHVSNEPPIPTKTLTVMLGNLLDDALEACKKQASYDRRIYASIRNNGKCMYLNVEYTCDGEQTNNSIGSKISSQLVNYYNGRLESSNVNGIHKTTAILRP